MTSAAGRLLFGALLACSAAAPAGEGIKVYATPRPAPDFALPGIDKSRHTLADFRGRHLLVNFWAVWCSPCRREMPSMQRVYERLKGEGLDMLAIHIGPSRESATAFADDLGLSFPIAVDEAMALGDWQVVGLPTTFLVDPEGRIVGEAVGEREWDSPEMVERLEGWLAQP